MITVHQLERSRAQRIVWLLEELDLDYQLKLYERDSQTLLAPAALVDVHPLGKSPVITHDGQTVAESGAIIEYLLDLVPDSALRPAPGSQAFLDYRYWLHYAEGSFMPLMLLSLIMTRIETAPVPFFLRPVMKGIGGKVREGFLDANVSRHSGFVEATLDERVWLCGDRFTAADIQMSYCLEALLARQPDTEKLPNIERFMSQIRQRDAYRRAESKAGSFDLPQFD